jgi:hypothetical protein
MSSVKIRQKYINYYRTAICANNRLYNMLEEQVKPMKMGYCTV